MNLCGGVNGGGGGCVNGGGGGCVNGGGGGCVKIMVAVVMVEMVVVWW